MPPVPGTAPVDLRLASTAGSIYLPPPASSRSRRYGTGASSPLPWALAAIGMGLVTFILLAVALASEIDGDSSSAPPTAYFALVTGFLTLCLSLGWLSILGKNEGWFGFGTVVNLCFPVWLIVFNLTASFAGPLAAVVIASTGQVIYYAWPVRQVAFGLGSGASFPPLLTTIAWAIGTVGVVAVNFSYLPVLEDPYADPSSGLLLAGAIASLGFGIYWLIIAIAATISQHVSIARDRRDARAAREAVRPR